MPYLEEPHDRSTSRSYYAQGHAQYSNTNQSSTSSSRVPHSQSYSNQSSHTPSTGYRDEYGYWHAVPRAWSSSDQASHHQAPATGYTSHQSQYSYPNSLTPTATSSSSTQSSSYTTASPSNNHSTTPLSLTNLSQHTNSHYSRNANLHAWASASQRSGPWDAVGHVLVERSGRSRDDARYYDQEGRERRGGRGRRNTNDDVEYH